MDRVKLIKPVLRKAGYEIRKNKNMSSDFSYNKGYSASIDKTSNNIIYSEIEKHFPDDDVLSEEIFSKNLNYKKSQFYWVTDPLCGTTNYLHGFPFFATALSLLKKNEIIASGIFDPNRDEMFFSYKNKSYLNEKQLYLKKNTILKNSIIFLNSNQSNWKDDESKIEKLVNLFAPPVSRRIHIIESANLELAYVASGRIDAYINLSDKVWDIIASLKMISNAGGSVEVINKDHNDILSASGIIAANNHYLFEELKLRLKGFNFGKNI